MDALATDEVGVASMVVAPTDTGALGGATGAAVTHVLAAPVPAALRAETRNTYATPFVRPLTTVAVLGAVTVPTERHAMPPFAEASTR
jgi:hypothetical protein